ncbi:MAG: hypothetical protein C0402_05345 [Thermodesulfovibrio sp.]|nr:hypothetical protein [Thermodesulfovibrio sp.]
MSDSSEKILDRINTALREYAQQGFNVPGVTIITEAPDFMKPSIRIVQIDTIIPHGKTSNDHIYSVGGGKFAFGRLAIQEFAAAGRINLRIVSTSAVRIHGAQSYTAKVMGERYEVDGAPKNIEDEKTYNLTIRAEEMVMKYEERAQKDHPEWSAEQKREFVAKQVKKVMIEKHKFAGEMAITGAQARVVTKMLGLKPAYALQELKKPFIIVAMTPVVDMHDPDIKRMVTSAMLGIRDVLYPTPAPVPVIQAPAPLEELALTGHSALEFDAMPVEAEPVGVDLHGPTIAEFEDCPRVVRLNILKRMVPGDEDMGKLVVMEDGDLVTLYRRLKAA